MGQENNNPFADANMDEGAFFPQHEASALSIVGLQKPTKENIQEIANNIISDIKENDEEYLNAYVQAKAIEEVAKAIQEGVKKDAMEEAAAFEKDQKFEGCTIVVKGLGDRYSFTDDEEWVKLTKQEAEIKERKKEIETLMIQASKVSQLVDASGVVITPAKLISHGGSSLAVMIPKK